MTVYYDESAAAAWKVIEHVGKKIVIGVPLGLGKPIGFLNALYRLAKTDASIELTIITGLTLARPVLHNDLEKRFIEPILQRTLNDFEDPLYEIDRANQRLPKNIHVIEFFLSPGKYLKNADVQQHYVSSKYTSAARDCLNYGINVLAQLITRSADHAHQYSLSCNTDLFYQVETALRVKEKAGEKIAIVGEVNLNLPFMYGDAVLNAHRFSDIIDTKQYKALFSLPRIEIAPTDHLIGLYTSCLIPDNSCLQIGIGKLGDAVANALIYRHKYPDHYQSLIEHLKIEEKFNQEIAQSGMLTPFNKGIYASTEMISDAYLHLYAADILKKRVYDDEGLQYLLNKELITETVSPQFIDTLLEQQLIQAELTWHDFLFLQTFGIIKPDLQYQEGELILPSGKTVIANLANKETRQTLFQHLGSKLTNGYLVHAAFFLGSTDFYQRLHTLPPDVAKQINMTSVSRTNSLLAGLQLFKLQRQNARFVNSAMMVTIDGAVVSDRLHQLVEVSGVGGQFDFVNMAHELAGARGIINCHSTFQKRGVTKSNIVWEYAQVTIPRYLRDIVVTEYGIADCRSKTDEEVIKAILNVTDSRFQKALLMKAKYYGKVAKDYQIPKIFCHNYPDSIQATVNQFQTRNFFKAYPFGSDLTDEEITIKKILTYLREQSKISLFFLMLKSLWFYHIDKKGFDVLARMNLQHPKSIKEFILKHLFVYFMKKNSDKRLHLA